MASKIDTKAKRDRLAIRREPYWAKVQKGNYVGFRRTANGGHWIARHRDDEGSQKYHSLMLPEHLACNEYDSAVAEARAWFESLSVGVKPRSGTLSEAADDYLKAIRVRKGERAESDAKWRIERHIRPQFGKRPIAKITAAEIERWLHAFVPSEGSQEQIRKAKATANRTLTTLKAILNHARKNGLVASSLAWDRVKAFGKVDGARKLFLSPEQVNALIAAATGEFKKLVTAGALIGARYGELRALRVRDLDTGAKILHIREGKTGERIVPLTDDMLTFFEAQTKDKLPDAYLFTRDDGRPWGHSDQDALMRQAAKEAKLPRGVVFYSLRHAFIASAISAGLDIYSIAQISGTSIRMIEKHYGKLLKEKVREVMAKAPLLNIA